MNIFAFLNKNVVRSVIAAVAAIAVVVKNVASPHTIAHQVSDTIIEGAVAVGVYASSSRIPNP